ncbi:MAG: pentapeptide repeat-containing protein [Treponema sp.]|nr:pentapeptide repeat-containing protein [Treponema sp.]
MRIRATFIESIFNNCKISQSNFESCNFWSAHFNKVSFVECNFEDACLISKKQV